MASRSVRHASAYSQFAYESKHEENEKSVDRRARRSRVSVPLSCDSISGAIGSAARSRMLCERT
jgi:hypothetical protein